MTPPQTMRVSRTAWGRLRLGSAKLQAPPEMTAGGSCRWLGFPATRIARAVCGQKDRVVFWVDVVGSPRVVGSCALVAYPADGGVVSDPFGALLVVA